MALMLVTGASAVQVDMSRPDRDAAELTRVRKRFLHAGGRLWDPSRGTIA